MEQKDLFRLSDHQQAVLCGARLTLVEDCSWCSNGCGSKNEDSEGLHLCQCVSSRQVAKRYVNCLVIVKRLSGSAIPSRTAELIYLTTLMICDYSPPSRPHRLALSSSFSSLQRMLRLHCNITWLVMCTCYDWANTTPQQGSTSLVLPHFE